VQHLSLLLIAFICNAELLEAPVITKGKTGHRWDWKIAVRVGQTLGKKMVEP